MFNLSQRIAALAQLGKLFGKIAAQANGADPAETDILPKFDAAIIKAKNYNGWFETATIREAFGAWANQLTEENLNRWMSNYPSFTEPEQPKIVAVIMAGNIPLVGLHDFLTVLLLGHQVHAKLSSDDAHLMPIIGEELARIHPAFAQRIHFVARIVKPDAVVATGSNNSARYFETYFGKYPHIIRKNRTSVALIDGQETEDELKKLGEDIFTYFGLGCRNVSKIYVPKDYDLNNIFAAIVGFDHVANNNKYANNLDYHRAIFMLNKVQFLENGFVIFKEDANLHTPISVMHYEYYSDKNEVEKMLEAQKDALQCVVARGENYIDFGKAQHPQLTDYADGVDTVEFLLSL